MAILTKGRSHTVT